MRFRFGLSAALAVFCLTSAQAGQPMTAAQLRTMCKVGLIEACEIYLRGAFEAFVLSSRGGTQLVCPSGDESPEGLRDLFLIGTGMLSPQYLQDPAINIALAVFKTAMPCQ